MKPKVADKLPCYYIYVKSNKHLLTLGQKHQITFRNEKKDIVDNL